MKSKHTIAVEIAERLAALALPDSRFGRDFSQFIPRFEGADAAAARLLALDECRTAKTALVTPDNSLTAVRQGLLRRGVDLLVPSYGLHRGFLLVEAARAPDQMATYAGWLDGIEHFGRPLGLADIGDRGPLDLIVAGASAVTIEGLRFGMGDFYLDIEWGVLCALGAVVQQTPIATLVHDVQVAEVSLPIAATNVTVDLIVTPTRALRASPRSRPTGLDWSIVPDGLRQNATLKAFAPDGRIDPPWGARSVPLQPG